MFIKNTRKERTQTTKAERKAAANQRAIESAEKTRQLLRDKKLKKYGVDKNAEYNNGEITNSFVQYMTNDSEPILKEYCINLASGKMKDKDNFFIPSDGKVCDLVRNFYDAEFGTPMAEIAIIDLTRWFNILRRQITRTPYDVTEKAIMGKVCQSYKTGNLLKGGICTLVGKESHRNILKEVAWLVTHAYCTGLFCTHKGIYSVLPKDNDQIITLWNGYINAQTDIPEEVRNLFIYSVENGNCLFLNKNKSKYTIFNEDGSTKSPSDDTPVEEEQEYVNIKAVNLNEEEKIKEKHNEMNEQYKDAIARDSDDKQATVVGESVKDLVHSDVTPMTEQEIKESQDKINIPTVETINVNVDGNSVAIPIPNVDNIQPDVTVNKEFTFGSLKRSETVNPAKIAASIVGDAQNPITAGQSKVSETDPVVTFPETIITITNENVTPDLPVEPVKEEVMGTKELEVVEAEVVETKDAEIINNIYSVNNKSWHDKTYRLEHFTKIVHDKGYRVFYDIPAEYPGLIQATIEKPDGVIVKTILLDDCSIYGDTLRVITNLSKNHDIRKEIFIPISQDAYVSKVIDGKLTVKDKEALISKPPKCIINCKGKYTFVDRVDMSGLHVGDIRGMDFDTWYRLVDELGKLVIEDDLTGTRWRIEYDKNNPDNLTMIADENVKYPFKSNIAGEANNIYAVKHNKHVYVDLSKHTDDGVAVYVVKELA